MSNLNTNEDASVFKISDDLALVQTLDFITPIVDSPYHFGAISAANSLSDVFAMGADVINALNIVGFNSKTLGNEILKEILEGANDKVKESKAIIIGGHSIESQEIFFGLSVTGKVNPNKFLSNNSAKQNELIILTKPIGTGIISKAIKENDIEKSYLDNALNSMMSLNLKASKIALKFNPSAMTDVTGFGLLGHLSEMINGEISIKFYKNEVLFLDGVKELFKKGYIPAGAYRNKKFANVEFIDEDDILFCDPQTSGGLLIAIDYKNANKLLKELKEEGIKASIIAECIKKENQNIILV